MSNISRRTGSRGVCCVAVLPFVRAVYRLTHGIELKKGPVFALCVASYVLASRRIFVDGSGSGCARHVVPNTSLPLL